MKIDNVKEVSKTTKEIKKIQKRNMVPPSPAEMGAFSNLQSDDSYSNYGNTTPLGTADTGGTATPTAPGAGGGTAIGGGESLKLNLEPILESSKEEN